MTQVANLNADMSAALKSGSAAKNKNSKDLLAEFAGIMNQNANSFLHAKDYAAGADNSANAAISSTDRTDSPKTEYERLGTKGSFKITRKEAVDTGETVDPKQVEQLAEEVQETLKETMQVTEEELAQAMESLGFTSLDLLQPKNLITLVQEMTGNTDVSALLTDDMFQLTMQEVSGLISEFQKETGLSEVQFSDLLEQLSAQINEMEEVVKQLLNVSEPVQEDMLTLQTELMPEDASSEMEPVQENALTKGPFSEALQTQTGSQNMQTETQETSGQTLEQTGSVAGEAGAYVSSESSDQEGELLSQNGDGAKQYQATLLQKKELQAEANATVFGEGSMVTNEPVVLTGTTETPQLQSYVELQQLMDQMEGLARTFASAEGTSVEMQLNPENLGRLVLTVTEKNGNVTAQIAASNEQVKEALQTQMVELRSTLQAQGIKVEAVEVTVATHEFEQNLDGNASANGQMQDQEGRQGEGTFAGRRNLNRNELDELSGLMSEEERLAAQMMKDNGGTVDFTA
ncbi:MAG: flagellar hook-length control protein FliK [bacterium]|nr:flagellar hook-length control protein FliK [bacterium]MDY4098678.1 flagellar hook-length control protein FliK [Lachnospiraceae bacterium]